MKGLESAGSLKDNHSGSRGPPLRSDYSTQDSESSAATVGLSESIAAKELPHFKRSFTAPCWVRACSFVQDLRVPDRIQGRVRLLTHECFFSGQLIQLYADADFSTAQSLCCCLQTRSSAGSFEQASPSAAKWQNVPHSPSFASFSQSSSSCGGYGEMEGGIRLG